MIQKAATSELAAYRSFLVESMERLAWPATRQRDWLETLGAGGCADELALELDDAMAVGDRLVDAGLVSAAAFRASKAVDAVLERISGMPEKWDGQALEHDPDWQEARELAKTALAFLASPENGAG